jgi:MSHA biogenesis protein MshP
MKTMRGFSLPTAIFLLVILALLGAFMISLSATQNAMSVQDVQGSRAYQAARAGMEWGLYSARYVWTPAAACPAPASTTLTIDSFSVTVACSLATHNEGGTPKYIFYVTSTASIGGAVGTVGRVERMVSSFVEF